jgi:hypothetical protein
VVRLYAPSIPAQVVELEPLRDQAVEQHEDGSMRAQAPLLEGKSPIASPVQRCGPLPAPVADDDFRTKTLQQEIALHFIRWIK